MADLSLFSYKEAIEFILLFYTFTSCCNEDDLEQIDGIKKFIELGFAEKDKVHDSIYVLSKDGEKLLHEYIKNISEEFIKYMKTKNFKVIYTETSNWFKEKFGLETDDDGEDISIFICENLHNYGYVAQKVYSKREHFIKLERV